jgi:hypothetical protein
VAPEPATSTFRIFGLTANAVDAITQLGSSNFSLAGSPFESINNQIKERLYKQQVNDDKEKLAKIPRPPNAFILYRQEHHPVIKAANPEFHNNDICESSLT